METFKTFLLVLIIIIISSRCAKLGSKWKTLNSTRSLLFSVVSVVLSLVGAVILYGAACDFYYPNP